MPTSNKPSPIDSPIFTFRKLHGLSRLALAEQIGVSSASIHRWEIGKTKPSLLALERIESLGLTMQMTSDTDTDTVPGNVPRIKTGGHSPKARGIAAKNLATESTQRIDFANNSKSAVATSWVRNGPPNQNIFHEALINMQLDGQLFLDEKTLARRFSLLQSIEDFGNTAQFELERPTAVAMAWNSNYGSHGWHRYVGRFPPHVIRALLNSFGANSESVVCDPFLGSGTTAVECRLLGIPFIGVEICPLSCLISRTKSKFPIDSTGLGKVVKEFIRFYEIKINEFQSKKPTEILQHSDVLSRRGNPIPTFSNIEKWFTAEALLGVSIAVEFALLQKDFEKDAILLAISAKMRSIGNVDVDVVRAEYSKKPRANVNVCTLVSGHLSKMARDIDKMTATHADILGKSSSIDIRETSILDLDLPEKSIDNIITSPPYGVEAISYLRTHLLSYRSLVAELKHDPYETRDKTIGSEYTPKTQTVCFDKASSSSPAFVKFFSLPTLDKKLESRTQAMKQFFEDLYNVGEKFSKWLKPGGNVAFVLGNKRLGDDIIPADEIVIEMFKNVGLNHVNSIKHKLKTNNSNSVVPWQDRVIDEEAILIFKMQS